MTPYSKEKILRALTKIPGWKLQGTTIRRIFHFDDFIKAVGFVMKVAILSEKAGHHPDITIQWNKVIITLTTHDAGGLTKKDFDLAGQMQLL